MFGVDDDGLSLYFMIYTSKNWKKKYKNQTERILFRNLIHSTFTVASVLLILIIISISHLILQFINRLNCVISILLYVDA